MSTIKPDYKTWGTAGSLNMTRLNVSTRINKITQYILQNILKVESIFLKTANAISYYQGPQLDEKKLILMRFEKNNDNTSQYNGEHLSLLLDESNDLLYGLMILFSEDAPDYLTHDIALSNSVNFLKIVSPDLFSTINELPAINRNSRSGEKITFKNYPLCDNVELCWIGKHDEYVLSAGKKIVIRGMKVKMFHPKTNSWTWVILNHYGKIITFEHHVFWNFEKGKRETQMWLHDQWLLEHGLSDKF